MEIEDGLMWGVLLNYENTHLLLIDARKKDVEDELGIDIDEEKESQRTADLLKN